jgi:CRP/FNR family nitrogen fixation transcriptional regulator
MTELPAVEPAGRHLSVNPPWRFPMSAQLAAALDRVSAFAPAFAARSLLQADAAPSETGWDRALPTTGGVIQIAHDSEIYGEGDDAVFFYKVVKGVVRTCKFLSDGRRQIEAFHREGDVFGFGPGASHRLTAETVSDCTLIAYRRKGVEQLATTNETLSQQLFGYFMEGLTRAQEHALVLGRRSAMERVGAFLHEAALQSADGRTITLPMTRQDIADYLGLTIETVSRTLSQLERDDVIAIPAARQIRIRDTSWLEDIAA